MYQTSIKTVLSNIMLIKQRKRQPVFLELYLQFQRKTE